MMKESIQLLLAVTLMVAVVAEPVSALDVEKVTIIQYKDHWANAPLATPYGIDIYIEGTGINAVSVTDPHGINHDFSYWGDDEWGFEGGPFASLPALDASYGPGSYVFTFNAGEADEDTVAIDYAYTTVPTTFANITYPADGQADVELNPVYTWDSVAGYADADALAMLVKEDPQGIDNEIYCDDLLFDLTATSWQPGLLAAQTQYYVDVTVCTAQSDLPTAMQTDTLADSLDYYGMFDYWNGVGFETVPEPTTLLLLALGGLALSRRRRGIKALPRFHGGG